MRLYIHIVCIVYIIAAHTKERGGYIQGWIRTELLDVRMSASIEVISLTHERTRDIARFTHVCVHKNEYILCMARVYMSLSHGLGFADTQYTVE